MTELLTAKDVEVKTFKKVSFGGYSVPEVEDFLNQVADDLEAYAVRLSEREQRILELEQYAKKQESMTDMIKDALIQARKTAKDTEAQAQVQREQILKEAQAEAAGILQEAREKRQEAERRLADLDVELEQRRRETAVQVEQDIAQAHAEARRIVEDASKSLEEYEGKLRFLNLQKQQFLKDTVALLLDFGKTIDKAQQEVDAEIGQEDDAESVEEEEGQPSEARF